MLDIRSSAAKGGALNLPKSGIAQKTSHLAHRYFLAKAYVSAAGFNEEIRWQKYLPSRGLDEQTVLAEAAWVILNGGMRERVVRGLFPKISTAFFGWKSAASICSRRSSCVANAMKAFNHSGKINAIAAFSQAVFLLGHQSILTGLEETGPKFFQTFSYLGPATAQHLAKNLGCNVAKPDRHLLRLAEVTGFDAPSCLCHALADAAGDSVAVVDLVLWRFATLRPNYLEHFKMALPD